MSVVSDDELPFDQSPDEPDDLAEGAAAEHIAEPEPRWIHASDAQRHRPGSLFGWADAESPTGFSSGWVVKSDPLHLRVLVKNILPAYIGAEQ